LAPLCRAYGVLPQYRDMHGRVVTAAPEILLHMARACGASVENFSDIPDALRAHATAATQQLLPGTHVVWHGRSSRIPLVLPEKKSAAHVIDFAIDAHHWSTPINDLPRSTRTLADGRIIDIALLDVKTFPAALPLGHHHLTATFGSATSECLLIVAPMMATASPVAGRRGPVTAVHSFGLAVTGDRRPATGDVCLGLFTPLYALRRPNDWGCGDFRTLRELADGVAPHGVSLIGTLPLLAAFHDEPFDPSPYQPISRLMWNDLYLDLTACPEFSLSPAAQQIVNSTDFAADCARLRANPHVDYRAVFALRKKIIAALVTTNQQHAERTTALRNFITTNPMIEQYAVFRETRDARRATQYTQWQMHEQLHALRTHLEHQQQGLYLDLPIGVHRDGFDVQQWPECFAHNVTLGAPPDCMFRSGQNWNAPPLQPAHLHTAAGIFHWRGIVQHHMRYAKTLRIDHVMGLLRQFWIPHGNSPRDGVYVRFPVELLTAVVCLESQHFQCAVVGENLGLVPLAANRVLQRHGFSSMYVAQGSVQSAPTPHISSPAQDDLACLGTHDMPSWQGFLCGGDLQEALRVQLYDAELTTTLQTARDRINAAFCAWAHARGAPHDENFSAHALQLLLDFLAQSPAHTLMIDPADLLGLTLQHNLPGTSPTQRPENWCARYPVMIDEIVARLALRANTHYTPPHA